ncbi:MAG: hypothetical protein Q4F24_01785 [Eubacteriales bacterium]|nr:hypothetical protein [Eubacteriales bacterium]
MIDKLLDMQVLFYCMIAAGIFGAVGMFLVNRSYKKKVRFAQQISKMKEKWMNLWKSRDILLHRMNRWVWYPSLACIFFLGLAVILTGDGPGDGISLKYLYTGLMVPVSLLLLRQALDISYRGELLADSMADYMDFARDTMEEKQVESIPPQATEEVVDHIARSIRECAATKGRFSQMLSPEEEAIMREVIKEFMES